MTWLERLHRWVLRRMGVRCGVRDGDYGTCGREPWHRGGHVEMRDGKLWAEWYGPTDEHGRAYPAGEGPHALDGDPW